jgi:phosphopentomutase
MRRKAEIDEMLARLQTLSDEHFNVFPDDVHWGHVGDLAHYAELLKRITDAAFQEGEHAA